MMKLVPLTRGKFAMVDDQDFDRVMQFKWRYAPTGRHLKKHDYAVRGVVIDGKKTTEYMHRFILGNDAPATDHGDGNGLNNQRYNLRAATRVENGRNRQIQVHSSRFKGVSRANGAWTAAFKPADKKVHLGTFSTEEAAAKAYDTAVLKHYGAFAKTNQQLEVYHQVG